MKHALVSLIFVSLFVGCRPRVDQAESSAQSSSEANFASKIRFAKFFDLSKESGQTYLAFMKTKVKPAMDEVATGGYKVGSVDAMKTAYKGSDSKVRKKVDNLWGGIEGVQSIAEALEGQTVTMKSLPTKIKQVDREVDNFGLATFIGLASGGGVAIKYADKNFAFNVHYDVKEQRSGRSFGTGPQRGANDASDKQYLTDLERYTKGEGDNTGAFYTGVFQALLNSDSSNYPEVSEEGQALLTDFLAVYTAEQARNLMDGRITLHWDAALLEVTLLANFHAGQDQLKLYFTDPSNKRMQYTSKTLAQTPCAKSSRSKTAVLADYWQFSKNVDNPSNCKRSGINITKNEFRKLGRRITSYMIKNHRDLYDNVKNSINGDANRANVFMALSAFLIDGRAAARISSGEVRKITSAWVAFLETMRAEAGDIDAFIEKGERSNAFDTEDGQLEPETPDMVSDGFDAIHLEDAKLGL